MGLYQTLIDQMFLDKYEDRPPDGFFHPSSLSGCDRMAVYEVSGTAPTDFPEVRNIRIMGEGTDVHTTIQILAQQEWPGFLTEVEINYGSIKGSADALRLIGEGWNQAIYDDTPEGREN